MDDITMLIAKHTVMLASFVFLCLLAVAARLDYKSVKLVYTAKVIVDPPVSEFYGDEVTYLRLPSGMIKEELEKKLFPQRYANGYKLKGRTYPVPKEYTIRWEEGFTPESGAVYYVGLGCEIERITYFFHSKYFSFECNPNSAFIVHSVSLNPLKDRSVITIYKGDVVLDW